MGEAKRRGPQWVRVEQAIARDRKAAEEAHKAYLAAEAAKPVEESRAERSDRNKSQSLVGLMLAAAAMGGVPYGMQRRRR